MGKIQWAVYLRKVVQYTLISYLFFVSHLGLASTSLLESYELFCASSLLGKNVNIIYATRFDLLPFNQSNLRVVWDAAVTELYRGVRGLSLDVNRDNDEYLKGMLEGRKLHFTVQNGSITQTLGVSSSDRGNGLYPADHWKMESILSPDAHGREFITVMALHTFDDRLEFSYALLQVSPPSQAKKPVFFSGPLGLYTIGNLFFSQAIDVRLGGILSPWSPLHLREGQRGHRAKNERLPTEAYLLYRQDRMWAGLLTAPNRTIPLIVVSGFANLNENKNWADGLASRVLGSALVYYTGEIGAESRSPAFTIYYPGKKKQPVVFRLSDVNFPPLPEPLSFNIKHIQLICREMVRWQLENKFDRRQP